MSRGEIPGNCDGGINAMVEGSKFKESHVLENTKLWNKVGRMPRPLVLFRPSNSGLASFCACFRYPVLGRSCPYASRHSHLKLSLPDLAWCLANEDEGGKDRKSV